MPEIDFNRIERLFRKKTSHNAKHEVVTSPTQETDLVASEAQHAESANTRPQPASVESRSDQSPSRLRQRLPHGGISGHDARVGFTLTSNLWMEQGRALQLHAGPSAVSWQLPLRAQNEDNKAGHARYAQARTAHHGAGESANPSPIWFDFARLTFQFQAGNLVPIKGFENEVTVPYGLQDFYLFMELLNQPPILPSGPNEGQHNYVWVFYTSLQFPQMTIKGYFEPEGVSWEDNAEAPTTLQWSATFLAHEMTPNPWERQEMLAAYTDFMRETVLLF